MKSYCWDNKGKEETEKYEFVKKYAEWIENPRQGECPYSDPDEVNNNINYVKNSEFYKALTVFLKCSKKKIQESCDFVLEFKEPTDLEDKSRKKPGDRSITVQKDENDYLYLTSDQFGFSAISNENQTWSPLMYPYAIYERCYKGDKSLIGDTIWYTRTIGGSFLWPKADQKGWSSLYNTNRGVNSYIEDRVDLTLYEIKEYLDYRNKRKQGLDKEKPINNLLFNVIEDAEKKEASACKNCKDKDECDKDKCHKVEGNELQKWFSLFENFETYVKIFGFYDFVNKEDDEYYPKDIFTGKSITKDNISEYREKGKSKYKFIQNKATKNDLEKAFINLIIWTKDRSKNMEKRIGTGE